MLRLLATQSSAARTTLLARQTLASASARSSFSTSAGEDEIKKFVSDVLTSKKVAKEDIEAEVAKLEKGNVKTMDLLRKLNIHDWDNLGVSVGAARAISDALFELKHNEILQKTQLKMRLRRENSSKTEARQKRL